MDDKVTFVAISGINFPLLSREYLIQAVADIVAAEGAAFVIVAGNAISGKYLERELKFRTISKHKQRKSEEEGSLIEEEVRAFNDFLPKLPGDINYHFILSSVYDGRLGAAILRRLREIRTDIRIIENPETGLPEEEAKIPLELADCPEMRVLVPRRRPWFYKNISGLGQRLVDAFVIRTFSPPPSMIIVGCTGASFYIPSYRGVPVVMVPTLHKIDEQTSSENSVGCAVVTISKERNVTVKFYNLKLFMGRIRESELLLLRDELIKTETERAVLDALRSSTASKGTIYHRLNRKAQKITITEEEIDQTLRSLEAKKIVVFSHASNRWSINPQVLRGRGVKLKLNEIIRNAKIYRHTVLSCVHIGALKTLYFTLLNHLPARVIEKGSSIFVVGDVKQGLAHNYEYSGELEPFLGIANDKQELAAAFIFAEIIVKIFEANISQINWATNKLPRKILLNKCLPPLIVRAGNHDLWTLYSKNSLPLALFIEKLKSLVTKRISELWAKRNLFPISSSEIEALVEKKIIFVGETEIVNVDGIEVGLKHPHKSRTLSRSQRIQECLYYFCDKGKDVPIVYVGNFHEAAAGLFSIFGKTRVGIMVGAMVADTQFEKNKDKKVEYGFMNVSMGVLGKEIIWVELDYDSHIEKADKEFSFADKIDAKKVAQRSQKLLKVVNIDWRR